MHRKSVVVNVHLATSPSPKWMFATTIGVNVHLEFPSAARGTLTTRIEVRIPATRTPRRP
jgi:hypothetical protein